MSDPAQDADAVKIVNEQDKDTSAAPIQDPAAPGSQVHGDGTDAAPAKVATSTADEQTEPLASKDATLSSNSLDKDKPVAKEDEKVKPAPSVHSKTSSVKKSLSNGKIFGKKNNGDAAKRSAGKDKETSTAGSAGSATSAASEQSGLKKDKKKKKRGKIWRFLHACFTPGQDGVLTDHDSAKSAPASTTEVKQNPKTPAAPVAAPTPAEKGNANLTVDTLAANAASTSAARPSTPSRSHPASATAADGEVVLPPTPRHELLPLDETEGVTSGAVQAPGSTGLEGEESEASVTDDERNRPLEDEDDEERLILNGGNGIPIGPDGKEAPLLPPLLPQHKGRKCLVLDLDETLVHSSFKLIPQADYVVPVEIEWQWHNVYVIKRPGVDAFLKRMGELYEIVVFTASLSKYADPVLDKLDVHKVVTHRLFRESCYLHKGNYVKDLSQLGRPVGDTIILDNSPASYIFHPNNAVPVSSWFNDPHDTELTDMSPFLADLAEVSDIRGVLDGGV